jgi:hypothetical protein
MSHAARAGHKEEILSSTIRCIVDSNANGTDSNDFENEKRELWNAAQHDGIQPGFPARFKGDIGGREVSVNPPTGLAREDHQSKRYEGLLVARVRRPIMLTRGLPLAFTHTGGRFPYLF